MDDRRLCDVHAAAAAAATASAQAELSRRRGIAHDAHIRSEFEQAVRRFLGAMQAAGHPGSKRSSDAGLFWPTRLFVLIHRIDMTTRHGYALGDGQLCVGADGRYWLRDAVLAIPPSGSRRAAIKTRFIAPTGLRQWQFDANAMFEWTTPGSAGTGKYPADRGLRVWFDEHLRASGLSPQG